MIFREKDPQNKFVQGIPSEAAKADRELVNLYHECLKEVLNRGWGSEIDWSRSRRLDAVDRREFFEQYAFCVFASFFRWSVVQNKWPHLTKAFKDWDYEKICQHKQEVEEHALKIFGNKKKVGAIIKCAESISMAGWDEFKALLLRENLTNQLNLLDELPGIGKAARYQLAGAIGIDCAKPDRYMLRLASQCGYQPTEEGVQRFAERVGKLVGERVKVVDYIFWRFSEGSCNPQ